MTKEYSYDVLRNTWNGDVFVAVGPSGLVACYSGGTEAGFVAFVERLVGSPPQRSPEEVREAVKQIAEYLDGDRQEFQLALDLSFVTPFQRRVLEQTARIPWGSVTTYGEIARRIGNPRSSQAVGQALRRNPMPLVIPCHRVIGSDGSLTGFGGSRNVAGKAALLRFEGALNL